MDCDILLKTKDGKLEQTFHSDEALDVYLFKHRDALSSELEVKRYDATLSAEKMNTKTAVVNQLNDLKANKFKNAYTNNARVTDFWQNVDKDVDFDKFDAEGYQKWFVDLYLATHPESSQHDAIKEFEKQKDRPANFGSDVHYGIQSFFDKTITVNKSDLHILTIGEAIVFGKEIGNNLKSIFDSAYGSGQWEAFSEYKIYTENVDVSKLRDWNSRKRAENPNHKDVTRISGTADLIVVDKDGGLHLYDFKTSKRSFDKWSSRKKKATGLQLETYAAILRQMGFNVKTTNVIAVNVDIDSKKASFEGIQSLRYDKQINELVKQTIPYETHIKVDNIKSTNDNMRTIFPSGNVDTIAKRKEADVEQYRRKLLPVRPDSKLAERSDFKNAITYFRDDITGKYIPCYNKQDENEKLGEYVNRINEHRSKELSIFGQKMAMWIKTNNLTGLVNYVGSEQGGVQDHLQFQFRKYITNGWNIIEDDVLFENGILIFERNGRIEIVMTDILNLNTIVPLKKGKSILGTVRTDTDVTDNRKIMDSRRGHMLLMKAMSFISENQNLFKNKKIQNIKAVNLHSVESVTASNSNLCLNWKLISASFPKLKLPLVEQLFMKDENSFIHQANDFILTYDHGTDKASNLEFRKQEYLHDIDRSFSRNEILRFIKTYQRSLGLYKMEGMSTKGDYKMPALNMLLQAYLSTFDVSINSQQDLGEIWTKKQGFSGTKISPMGVSPSGTLRSVEEINSLFERNVEQQFKQIITPWQIALKKLYEDPNSRYSSLKGSSRFFEDWFRVDENGKIDERFMLKDPVELPKSEAQMCQMFLDVLAELRGLTTPEQIEEAKATGVYYQVPLIKGRFFETIRHKGGIKNAFSAAIGRIADLDVEQTFGLLLSEDQKESLDELSIWEIDNYLLDKDTSKRDKIITDKGGVATFSTDLDLIFLTTVALSLRSKLSRYYIPALTAFRVFLEMESATNSGGGNTNKNTKAAVTDWMRSVVYGQSLIDPHNQFWAKLAAILKRSTSFATLGLSTTSFTREGLTSTIVNFINSQNGLDPDIDAKTLANAYMDMTSGLKGTLDITSKDQQFNTLFGVAEMSYSQMARANRTNPYGLANMDGDIFYITSTSQDFYHRNAIVKTKLIKRGAYDAYSIDDEGKLVYDFTKDKQWELIQKYKTVRECPKEQREEWFKQKDHYESSIKAWNKLEGYEIKIGDPLPQALNPDELDGLRIFVNLLHGFYDDSQKVLMQKELLGGLFMQYKTVPLARLQMQNHPTGAINITDRRPVKDTESGKQIYEIIDEHDIATGFMLEGEEGLEELISKGLARPYYVSMGNPLIGKVDETLSVIGTIWKCAKEGDFTAFKEHFNDAFKRRTLFIALWDLLGMSLLSFIINAAFGDTEQNLKEVGPMQRWAWTVLTGAAEEGPVWSTAKSIIGDGTLPMVSTLSRWGSTAWGIVTGNTPVLYGLLNTFGATRPLSNLVYE